MSLKIEPEIQNCEGFIKLLTAVQLDQEKSPNFHDYFDKLDWIVSRAKHYAEKTGLKTAEIIDAWEARRDYWYMNYYHDGNQPLIDSDKCRVFETVKDLQESIGNTGFRCPACEGVSKSPYACDAGTIKDDKKCDWKVYGLFGHLGKGVSVFAKDKLKVESLFMPIAWEKSTA